MLSKLSVKKPMTVFVAVVLVLVLGIVSFTKMTPDLMPNMYGFKAKNLRKSNNSSSDLYDIREYEKGDPQAINSYNGEFMIQYDWAYLD